MEGTVLKTVTLVSCSLNQFVPDKTKDHILEKWADIEFLFSTRIKALIEQWRGWIEVWYISYIVRTFVNTPMYPHPAQQY
jgi:hypothetical protein